jgi:2-oxoglutarate ferredoxin oxidoreductase subunit alpha
MVSPYRRFGKVMTVEGTWADRMEDEVIDSDNRRYAPLAMMLRSRYLVDVDCWSEARGAPMKPANVVKALRAKLGEEK